MIMFKNVICCLASLFKEGQYFLSSARKTRAKTKTLRRSGLRAAYCYPRNRSEVETNPSWARRPTSTYWWSLVSSWWVCVWGGAAWRRLKRSTANWWTPSSPFWLTVYLPSTSGWVFDFVDNIKMTKILCCCIVGRFNFNWLINNLKILCFLWIRILNSAPRRCSEMSPLQCCETNETCLSPLNILNWYNVYDYW